MTDIELNQYHTWVDNAEKAYVQKHKHEISHNEYINNIIEAIEQNTPLDGLGTMEVEDLLELEEDEKIKETINQWLSDDYSPIMNEHQWSEISKALAQ